MTIALVGSGEYLKPIEPVDRALLHMLDDTPRVVCLPTAAGNEGSERVAYWSNLGIQHYKRLGARVTALPVVDRDSADNKEFADEISFSNFIYLSGGKPTYLYEALEGSLVWDAITDVLKAGGILAGCSAGAMIMGEAFFSFTGVRAGFNFISGAAIIPHFDEIPVSRLDAIYARIPDSLTAIGIDGNTALVRNTDTYRVLGSGSVTVWNQSGKTQYAQGPIPLEKLTGLNQC